MEVSRSLIRAPIKLHYTLSSRHTVRDAPKTCEKGYTSVHLSYTNTTIYAFGLARHPPSSLSKRPCTSRTAPFRSFLASSHSPSAVMASKRNRLCNSSSPSRICSWARSVCLTSFPVRCHDLSAGCGGGAEEVLVGCNAKRKSSTSGCSFRRTFSSSVRICAMVLSSVRRSGTGLDETLLSPPPIIAIFEFCLIPYADTECNG